MYYTYLCFCMSLHHDHTIHAQFIRVNNEKSLKSLASTTVLLLESTTVVTNIPICTHISYDLAVRDCDTTNPFNATSAIEGDFYDDTRRRKNGFLKLIRCAAVCNDAPDPNTDIRKGGTAEEKAMVAFASGHIKEEYKTSIDQYRQNHPQVHRKPYDNTTKYALSIHELDDQLFPNEYDQFANAGSLRLIQMVGAPERILAKCDRYYSEDETHALDNETRGHILGTVNTLGSRGETVWALAELILPVKDAGDISESDYLGSMVFIGVMGMKIPPRPGIPEAIEAARSVGVKVVLVSGDHPVTQQALAYQIGVFSPHSRTKHEVVQHKYNGDVNRVRESEYDAIIVNGWDLDNNLNADASDEEYWRKILSKDNILFSRVNEDQILLIVKAFQDTGCVVTAVGSDKDDIAFLEQANVGVSMGISGKEEAIEAADLVILRDDLGDLVDAMKKVKGVGAKKKDEERDHLLE
eukprot:808816_1